ncbi:short-chain dehydrogenase/reductase SDR [Glycocaulis alkaliphilus]|uniref:Short-chain dehydrogenase/reductase SDR n=1 Tax=Glycocaulis alkaliphilus TaxID=1434191 RepID=A0A3T0EAC2_9PROT|nr:SDR family NAD(P)-dependent oxidoreductase [Glycocaulis alkaliphilus]AZU04177.1 short-chain dehydrogenase/reductase SDR [Glycocaulis alkaliphilus]
MRPRAMKPSDGIAWVTGGSSGIGAALAKRLAGQGWTVVVSARSADKLERIAAEHSGKGRIIAHAVDLTDAEGVEDAVKAIEAAHGPIALAVLNAGIYLSINAENPSFEDYKKTFDVNLSGTAACLCALTPRMSGRRAGQIAIVSSATSFGGMPTSSAYGASKAALVNMAACLRIELHRYGVLCQAITPGFVETPAQDDNAFPKPFMVSAETAAKRIASGLKSKRFEITFPRRFTWALKAIYALPYSWSLGLVRKQTGWDKPAD